MLKVFKFKKYKEGYEGEKRGISPRYSLDIGSFLKGEGQDSPESSAAHAAEVETSMNALSNDAAPLTSSSLPTAPNAGRVVGALSATVEVTSLNTPLRDVVPLVTSPPPTVLDTVQVARAAP